jgi:predicted RNA-binding protein YlqC (UPF0109 family)
MEDLLAYVVKGLVDHPEEVTVDSFEEDDALVLELRVADDDTGKVIGRSGRTVHALRTVMRACGSRHERRVLVDIVD